MEDTDPLCVPVETASTNSGNVRAKLVLHGTAEPSSSGIKEEVEEPLSDDLCIDTGINRTNNSALSNNSEDLGDAVYMTMSYEHEFDDDENDDEGLYLAINNIPVKVELEEDSEDAELSEGGFKVEVKEEDEENPHLENDVGNEGTASTSGNDEFQNTLEMKQEHLYPPKPKRTRRRRRRTYFCEEDRIERRRILAKERARKYRNGLTKDQLLALREKDRERTKKRRLLMTEEESLLTRIKNREQAQMRRLYKKETIYKRNTESLESDEEKAMLIREKNRERMRLKRRNMTEEEKVIERKKNRDRVRKRREIKKAEALLHKLMNVHSDMVQQNSHSDNEHFLHSYMDGDKVEAEALLQKLMNVHSDMVQPNSHCDNEHFLHSFIDRDKGQIEAKLGINKESQEERVRTDTFREEHVTQNMVV